MASELSGRIIRSADEWLMSRSCHNATFSSAGTELPLTSLARPQMRSVSSGFRLWGMDEEPVLTYPGIPNGSSTSLISVRCNARISVANFSNDAANWASVLTKLAWRWRGTIWLDTGAGAMPSCRHTDSSISGGMPAYVPTGPDILPTETSSRESAIDFRWSASSLYHVASFRPKLIGSAWTPCDRPMQMTPMFSSARTFTASISR